MRRPTADARPERSSRGSAAGLVSDVPVGWRVGAPYRARLAVRAGLAVNRASRLLRAGGGSTVGGRVMLALMPDVLHWLARNRRVVLVSGTNGKTTTTALIAAALGTQPCWNAAGSNMPAGLATSLAESAATDAVLEVDELYLASAVQRLQPQVVVLLNLSRDQLDRTLEVRRIAQQWHAALDRTGAQVVANAGDPLVAWAAMGGQPERGRSTWVLPPTSWRHDSTSCPSCGDVIGTEEGGWRSACGLHQPAADVSVTDRDVVLKHGTRVRPVLQLPGRVNLGNAAFAIAAATLLGTDPSDAAARIGEVSEVAGRYRRIDVAGRPCRLVLAKNPAGWDAALALLPPSTVLAVSVNARRVDGEDTSWLWDVPFEQFAGRPVAALGERASDVALRLRYADAEPLTPGSLTAAARALPAGDLHVLADYSSFRRLGLHVA